MLTIQRSDSLRGREGGNPPGTRLLAAVMSGKPAERSVSFNRDVHVKRIGRGGAPRVTAALAGDGEGKLILTSVHKEDVSSRSKEDLAQEAALVLQQAGNVHCVAHDNRRFSTLPARRNKKRPELPLDVKRRGSGEIGETTDTPRAKKKPLERSASDASAKKLKKGSLARFFSPKLEKRRKPVGRSASDTDACARLQRKRSGSESEGSHLSASRAKKQLSPIIEASPHVDQQQPFNFGVVGDDNNRPEAKKAKQEETIEETKSSEGTRAVDAGESSPSGQPKVIEHRIIVEGRDAKEEESDREVIATASPAEECLSREGDEADGGAVGTSSMLHSSRYDLQQRNEQSTIRKMIHRLSNDRSPPPQLTMLSSSPAFGHIGSRPFSYTRPNDSCVTPPPVQTSVIYAQPDKKKAQRSHSDSDEGLGLERKDSSRENSPAEKEYRRIDYSYSSDLRRNNEINSFKSRYQEERQSAGDSAFGKHFGGAKDFIGKNNENKRHEFDEIDKRLYDKPEKYTSTVFVDTSGRGRADGMDSRRRDSGEQPSETGGISNKTSELSARRDLLESRIKSRLLADEMFAANTARLPIKKSDNIIIDKLVVPSPVTPSRVAAAASPKQYTDNGRVYGYERKSNHFSSDSYLESSKPRDDYTPDKYDKYSAESPPRKSSDLKSLRKVGSSYKSSPYLPESRDNDELSSPIIAKKLNERKFSKSEDFLDRGGRPVGQYHPKTKRNFESIRGMSKSTQRIDEVGENARVHALRREYTTRSHENLSSVHPDYVNARDMRRTSRDTLKTNGRKERSSYVKRHLDSLHEGPNDDYDTDISQMTSSQLESKFYKETRTTQRYTSGSHAIHDDYDSSPPRIRTDRGGGGGYNSSRYDSDATARDSVSCQTLRKNHRKPDDDPKKPLRRSRNHLDYYDDSDGPRGKVSSASRLETFDEGPVRPPRSYHHHESKSRHGRQEVRGHTERRHRGSRLSDPDRKDRLADSGIENDYRRDSQEVDRREQLESEDESFLSRQFIKHERRHTDRNMNPSPSERRKYDKYANDAAKTSLVTTKPPSGVDKKFEKKAAKKHGTMSKVKQLFTKKEKKTKQEKSKRSSSSGAFTDDEVTVRYREYRGNHLRSAKSARDLGSDINQEDYSQRRRLSTPNGSPFTSRQTRPSRSIDTLTRQESFCESTNTLTRDNQVQDAKKKGWFKSLSRKNKSNGALDKKAKMSGEAESGSEDEETEPEFRSCTNYRYFGDSDQESVSVSNKDNRYNIVNVHASPKRTISSSNDSTAGESQQSVNSQRSVVYLHAATVGKIPGPSDRRRASSREELNRPFQSHMRTVSRSVSVLAPWKPRYSEQYEINYDQQQQLHQQHAKPTDHTQRRQLSHETLSRQGKESRNADQKDSSSTINRTMLKSKDKQKVNLTHSTESLASKSRGISSKPELIRSTSVPRDVNKSAGWLRLKNKKSRA